jgi:hypothetical protein
LGACLYYIRDIYSLTEYDMPRTRIKSSAIDTVISVGTTAQRPATASNGAMRINSTTSQLEVYYNGSWTGISFVGYFLEIFVWGAGGGSGNNGSTGGSGGGGGAATGIVIPTVGVSYSIVVGGGGLSRAANAGTGTAPAGGGGLPGNLGYGGQGGGYSGIFTGSVAQVNSLLIAGGGGGGGYEGAVGGAGGGTTGTAGGNGNAAGGGGGTQSAGGTSPSQAGSALQGGSSGTEGDSGGGGGGGGGYYGGGAGSNTNPGSAGGGGSGYVNTSVVSSYTLYSGSGTTPGNNTSLFRGSAGQGGATGTNAGTDGVVVIRYFGTQKGTGGTVTSSGGYTYHTFTSSGTYTP